MPSFRTQRINEEVRREIEAIIATAVGAVIGLVNVDISFFTATIPTGLVYYFCMKHMPSCQRFRKGTSLEK